MDERPLATSKRPRTADLGERPKGGGERNRSRGRGLRPDLAGLERGAARFRMLMVGAIRLVPQRSRIMTSTQPGISPLRQRMTDDMRMRQLSPATQAGYLRIVREFARYLKRSPDTATVEDLRNYQLYLVDRGTSPVSLNAAITGLKFFFEITLQKPELMARMQPVRVPPVLPVILSPDEVRRLIAATSNLKHQTALSLAYGTGLRAGEVVALKVGDIDSQRMTLRVDRARAVRIVTRCSHRCCSSACGSGGAWPARRARCRMAAGYSRGSILSTR